MLENNQKEIILLENLGYLYPTSTSKQKKLYAMYKCFCGNEFKAEPIKIRTNHTKSCGCLKTTHGFKNHRLYYIWNAMINRCNNKENKDFINYGGRGITVCDRWHNIKNFIDDMFPSYQKGLKIDRIDNNLGYSKDNCRWTNQNVQSRNTRKLYAHNKSGYRGVSWKIKNNKWISQISINNKVVYIGSFSNALDGALAYDNYIIENNLEHTRNFS